MGAASGASAAAREGCNTRAYVRWKTSPVRSPSAVRRSRPIPRCARSPLAVAAASLVPHAARILLLQRPAHAARVSAAPVAFQTKSAISVRIGRVDLLPPGPPLRSERKLRIAPHSQFAPEPKPLADSEAIEASFFLEAGSTAIPTAQSGYS